MVTPIFLKRYLVFPFLLFSSISLHLLKKAFLSLLALLWNSATHSVGYIFPFLLCLFFFPQIFGRTPQTTTLLTAFLFLVEVLVTTSYRVLETSVHSSSGALSIKSNALNLFVTSSV